MVRQMILNTFLKKQGHPKLIEQPRFTIINIYSLTFHKFAPVYLTIS